MKIYRIRKNMEFRTVYRRGKSVANDILVMYIFKNNRNKGKEKTLYNKVGISVSKKVGNSVIRSRVKRLIYESYRLNSKDLKPGFDFVFIARTSIKDKTYKETESAMLNLFKKAGLINNDEKNSNQNS